MTITTIAANESLLQIFGEVNLHSYAEQKEIAARVVLSNKVVSVNHFWFLGGGRDYSPG